MRVLIVEDDPLLANGLTETLRREGYVADSVASVSALARRGRAQRSRLIEHGPLAIDLDRRRATISGKSLDLSHRELTILEYLFSNVDAIVGKDKIANAVVSWDEHMSHNAVE